MPARRRLDSSYLVVVGKAVTGAHSEGASQEENQEKWTTEQLPQRLPNNRLISTSGRKRFVRGSLGLDECQNDDKRD